MPLQREPDEVLCRRAAGGDSDAFRLLVEIHERRLRAFLAQLGGSDLGDELAQETFIKAWKSLPGFRGEAKFSSWLCGIGWRLRFQPCSCSGCWCGEAAEEHWPEQSSRLKPGSRGDPSRLLAPSPGFRRDDDIC